MLSLRAIDITIKVVKAAPIQNKYLVVVITCKTDQAK